MHFSIRQLPKSMRAPMFIKDILRGSSVLDGAQENEAVHYLARFGFPFDVAPVKNRLYFHPMLNYWAGREGSFPALIGLANSEDDDLRALQISFLGPDWHGLAPLKNPRLYLGPVGPLVLPLSHGSTGRCFYDAPAPEMIMLAHSIETGFLVARALPQARVWVTLSNHNLIRFPLEHPMIAGVEIVWENTPQARREEIRAVLAKHSKPIVERSAGEFDIGAKA